MDKFSFLARSEGFCPGAAAPIASLSLVAAPKKQSTGLFFYGLFESLRKYTRIKKTEPLLAK